MGIRETFLFSGAVVIDGYDEALEMRDVLAPFFSEEFRVDDSYMFHATLCLEDLKATKSQIWKDVVAGQMGEESLAKVVEDYARQEVAKIRSISQPVDDGFPLAFC